MRIVVLAGLAGLAVALAAGAGPAAVWGFYQEIYPSDPAKREALEDCIAVQPGFNRLDSAARLACYRSADLKRARPPVIGGNFVDRWRAAGQGHLPQDDIRAEQQTARYIQSIARSAP